MQYIIPRDDTSSRSLSLPERAFLRNAARGVSSSAGSILRLDGRAPSEARPIRLSFSRCHNRAECTVQLGNGTRSAASVRAELVPPPNADRPNDGQVKFGVEVGPMGCMGFENTVPVSNYAVGESVDGGQAGSGGGGDVPYIQRLMSNRILRLLERTLLIGGSIDAEALCVQSGVWVWRLHVDVSLLDDGGNAMDACVLAAVAALRHYRLPEVSIGGDGDDVETSEAVSSGYQETNIIHSDDREPTPLPLHHTPLTATFALFADETGTTTAVSALLDPYDREELACDGLLTWSFNKYGEMCCVDFPGGCELRPRQLTASSNLGKRRCIEICELLETALVEAESKAQQDRMDRLKQMNAMRQRVGGDEASTTTMSANVPVTDEDEEDEQYRLRALDYSSGHIAAPVKEDKEKKGSQGKNMKGETSSLFHAILRSAQSTSLDKPMDEDKPLAITTNDRSSEKKSTVEIVAHKVKPAATITKKTESTKPNLQKSKPVQSASLDDSDEEEVVQLQSEFTTVEQAPDQGSAAPMEIDSNDGMPAVAEQIPRSKKSKSTTRTEKAEEDDVDDLAMAVKKKKKSKKPKKK
jgi:exosome complex component RRP45